MNRRIRLAGGCSILVAALIAGFCGTARGQSPSQSQYSNLPRIEIAPFLGYRFGGSVRDNRTGRVYRLESNWSHGLTVDVPVADDFRVEFRYSRQRSFVNAPLDTAGAAPRKLGLNVDNYQATGLLDWGYGFARPYIFVGLALTHLRVETGGSAEALRPAMNSGLGTKLRFSQRLGMRIEMRGQVTFVDTDPGLWCNPVCSLGWSTNALWQGEASAGINFRL